MTALALILLSLLIPADVTAHGVASPEQQPPRDARAAVPADAGVILGVVTTDDAQPRPLRRARVTLTGADMPRMVITGDDGTFMFTRVAAGRYTMAAAKDGYVAMSYGATRAGRAGMPVQLANGQSASVSLRLPHGAVITGTVLDVDGMPAPGIPVSAMTRRFAGGSVQYRYAFHGIPVSAITDDRGVYRIFGLPAGDYLIAARPETRDRSGGVAEVRTVSGGVVSDRGRVLTQVFHPGSIDVASAARVSVRAGEERSGIDIPLEYVPLATISGTAPGAEGYTATLVGLARTDEGVGYENGRMVRVDAAGAFRFSGVSPGRYRIVATSRPASTAASSSGPWRTAPLGDALTASADVVVSGEDITNVALALQPALTIAGKVAFEGERPAPGLGDIAVNVPLNLTTADSGYPFPQVQIRADGTFRAEGVLPGQYFGFGISAGIRVPIGSWWLKSIVADGRDLLDRPFEIRQSIDDAVVTFADRASEISGTVRDAGGAPALEPYVVVFSRDRSTWFPNSRRVAAVRPDRAGRYTIRNLPAGEYCMAAADLDANEWFDPVVLERLLPSGMPLTIGSVERQTVDLTIR